MFIKKNYMKIVKFELDFCILINELHNYIELHTLTDDTTGNVSDHKIIQ